MERCRYQRIRRQPHRCILAFVRVALTRSERDPRVWRASVIMLRPRHVGIAGKDARQPVHALRRLFNRRAVLDGFRPLLGFAE